MEKRLKYLYPIIFLLTMLFLIWLVLIKLDLVTDNETRITSIIALFGISFAIFQFWVSEINTTSRNQSQLRYNEYQQIYTQIEEVAGLLNIEMMRDIEIDAHAVVSALMNKINRIKSFVNINNDYLFPGINNADESKQLNIILTNILHCTDTLRKEIEEANKCEDMNEKHIIIITSTMNWNNKIRDYLKELNSEKYKFYGILKSYM